MSWWKTGVVYQVYPRSFMDSNGDGVGDLPGITSKLEYLEWLGVDALWLSPFYPSPMKDFGYDVSDFRDVDPVFGNLEDFDALVSGSHRRGMKVIVDYVPNHSSDMHEWFVESRSSKDSPKREWYIWRDGKDDGSPPNNWESIHGGGSVWEFDEASGQYYLHMFQPEQPDLNWHNPDVREAMYDVMRFWMDRGVDGFRIDALPHMAKDSEFRDDLPNPEWRLEDPPSQKLRRIHSEDRPEVLDFARGMRSTADEYDDRLLIGEIYRPLPRLMEYYGENLDLIHMPYNFGLVLVEGWSADAVAAHIEAYEAALPEGAAPNWVLGNHDNPRVASRVGTAQSRVAQMLLLTLRGSPTIYYGDEIGMTDGDIPPYMAKDPQSESDPSQNRDPERTPMQWSATGNAGFTAGEPWLPVSDPTVNVEAQKSDPHSTLALTRRLIELRRENPALALGSYRILMTENPSVLGYMREYEGNRVAVLLNFGDEEETLDLSNELSSGEGEILLSTGLDREGSIAAESIALRPNEGIVASLERFS